MSTVSDNQIAAAHTADTSDKPDHIVVINGKDHLVDTKGRYVSVDMVRPMDLLIDETVRKIVQFTEELSAQVGRYKGHTLDDVAGVKALIAQEHGVNLGGAKGNITLTSFDGLKKVTVKIADLTIYGPELQAAKAKVTECLQDWSDGARPELVAVVENAFQVDQEGRVNRSDLLYLTRLNIDDPRWKQAMELIRAAERPIGTKEYVQVHVRKSLADKWEHVTVDVAAA